MGVLGFIRKQTLFPTGGVQRKPLQFFPGAGEPGWPVCFTHRPIGHFQRFKIQYHAGKLSSGRLQTLLSLYPHPAPPHPHTQEGGGRHRPESDAGQPVHRVSHRAATEQGGGLFCCGHHRGRAVPESQVIQESLGNIEANIGVFLSATQVAVKPSTGKTFGDRLLGA